jgi:hypothetical protein
MRDEDSVAEHLNTFKTVVIQLVYVDIKISNEDKCINLMVCLIDSWDSLIVSIGSNTTTFKFDELVSPLLSEDMRRNRTWRDISQEDAPRKEIDLIPQVGDVSLREYISLLEIL